MSEHWEKFRPWMDTALILLGGGFLIGLEIVEDPQLSFGEVLIEMIQPALIVITAVGVIRVMDQLNRQHHEQMGLIRDLEIARSEGAQWRNDMQEVVKGLGHAIDKQFEGWKLTRAEREVAMLLLKGLSHKEIASMRDSSERTVRQQARAVYGKSKLSGRSALAAYFLEDLLLPSDENGINHHQEER